MVNAATYPSLGTTNAMTEGGDQSDWDQSAAAWFAALDEHGDYARTHILDSVMCQRIAGCGFASALDVGCGEGRFCRMMREHGTSTVGVDPTRALLDRACHLDSGGDYSCAHAEELPFPNEQFDLVISYLSLIDIVDIERAIAEMRVSRLPWAAASAVVLGFIAVVLWQIYAPSPDVWTDDAYIEANYREVQLRHVRAGQRARIHVDAYNIDLEGKVVDVPAASGTTFATL
jgi:SAM-dependent methyltransferase